MKAKITILVCAVLVLGLAASTWAIPVEVKVDIYGTPTLDGTWSTWAPGLGPTSGTFGGVNFTFDTSHGDGGDDFPYWWWPYGMAGGSGDALIEDGYYTESTSPGAPCFTELTIGGLTTGTTYILTNYHNLSGEGGGGGSATISGSGGAAGGSGTNGTVTQDASDYTASGTTVWTWTHGAGDAVIKTDYSGGRASINGFTLIPEPATMALLGLGSLALLRKKR